MWKPQNWVCFQHKSLGLFFAAAIRPSTSIRPDCLLLFLARNFSRKNSNSLLSATAMERQINLNPIPVYSKSCDCKKISIKFTLKTERKHFYSQQSIALTARKIPYFKIERAERVGCMVGWANRFSFPLKNQKWL